MCDDSLSDPDYVSEEYEEESSSEEEQDGGKQKPVKPVQRRKPANPKRQPPKKIKAGTDAPAAADPLITYTPLPTTTGKGSAVAAEDETTKKPNSKRKHHAIRTCPVCNKEEANLKRHLLMHARKGSIEPNQVDKLLAVAIHQTKKRGPKRTKGKKGLTKKWCPVQECS